MTISMKEWLEQGEKKESSKKKKVLEKVEKIKMVSWKDYLLSKGISCPHCPGVYANEIMQFVGFRGSIDSNGICHLNLKGEKHEGEAYPPPITPVTNTNRENLMRLTGLSREELGSRFYLGILKYEVEIMTLIFTLAQMGYENIALLMARGMGKTYMFGWDDQLTLKYFDQNIMMLSETNARKKIGNWIYLWALKNKNLKDPERFARQSTYQHFELTNGIRMDIYKYSEEDLVGEHDVLIKMDDIVKRKWKEKPSENEKMIEHYQSNINYIIRSGLRLTGTCKFEGDLINHIITNTEDMVIIKQSPFIECPHNNRNDDGTYDPCDVCKDDCLLAPELHSYKELIKKMWEDFESWYAEMMQNPKPMKGGMVDDDDLDWINKNTIPLEEIQVCGIGVDSTESDTESTDMCGIISCIMHGTELPNFTFVNADVRKMPFRNYTDKRTGKFHRGIIETIAMHVSFFENNYPGKPIIIAIERQGGGVFIIKEARNNIVIHPWAKYITGEKDKSKKGVQKETRYGIFHTKEKIARIFSELRFPIKEKQVHFDNSLFGNEFITQLLTIPNGRFDDGPDAGGMIKDELLKKWVAREKEKIRETLEEKRVRERAQKQWELMSEPWVAIQRSAASRQRLQNKRKFII